MYQELAILRFSKKSEYALIAMQHMAANEESHAGATSAREIAVLYHVPQNLLAKVMQGLAAKGFIKSIQGVKGGYILARKARDISVGDILSVFDGKMALTECMREEKIDCPQWNGCTIRDPFFEINRQIHALLQNTTILDLLKKKTAGVSMPMMV